ncbi:MAG: site-2 protease family protein [Clostridia bacterium]|nr:site-2 protease family protein [Clostridia bacterium]
MEFWQLLLILFGYVVLILVMLPVHELAHAFVANKLGDDTARWHGRLTANPFAHLDLWGTLMLFVFGFGYARPVPVNPRNFRNPKRDMALVALAGPVSNLLMAAISLLLYRVVLSITSSAAVVTVAWLVLVWTFASVNIGLAVFNLLPIPPLDGSRIFGAILPARMAFAMDRYAGQIRILLFVLIATGALSTPLSFLSDKIGNLLCMICGLPALF